MSKINVVHICDKFGMKGSTIHGASRLFAWWFPRFDRERFNVKLYALKRPDQSSRTLENEGVQLSYLGKSAYDPSTMISFLAVIKRERADVMHLHGWIAANFGRVAGRLAGVPTIMHEHGISPKFPLVQRLTDKVLAPFTHTAVAVSRSVRDFMVANRSVAPQKIRIIYNGAPLEEFSPAGSEQIARLREEFGIPPGSRVIGSISRLDKAKGLAYLIRAARRVVDAAPDVRFLLVGDGPDKEEFEHEVEELGLSANVIFAGHRSDVVAIQSMLDMQVFPTLWEGVPLTVFEAMASGRTILSTPVGGLGEVLNDGHTALFFEPENVDQLTAVILKILSDKKLADRLAINAKEESKKYNIRATVRNLESLYEELYLNR